MSGRPHVTAIFPSIDGIVPMVGLSDVPTKKFSSVRTIAT